MRAERTTNRAGAPPRSMTKPGPPPGAAIAAGDIGTARVRSGDGDRTGACTGKVTVPPPQVPPIRSAEKQIHCYRHGGRSECNHANSVTQVLTPEEMRPLGREPNRDGRGARASGPSRHVALRPRSSWCLRSAWPCSPRPHRHRRPSGRPR